MRYKDALPIGNSIVSYPIEVVMEGQFLNVMKMFSELETFSKEIKIEQFTFKRKSVSPLVLSVNLNLNAYVIAP